MDETDKREDRRFVARMEKYYRFDDFLRKDAVFLFERFFYFLEEKDAHGVLVMDETDKREDRRSPFRRPHGEILHANVHRQAPNFADRTDAVFRFV